MHAAPRVTGPMGKVLDTGNVRCADSCPIGGESGCRGRIRDSEASIKTAMASCSASSLEAAATCLIDASAVSEARFQRRGWRQRGSLARFRYSRLNEAARGCGGRGPYGD